MNETSSLRLYRVVAGLALTLAACLNALGWVELPLAAQLDRWIYDGRIRLQRLPLDARIVIVDIDEHSLAERGRWPWSRSTVAELVERIAAQRPAAIGLDLVFAEPQDDSDRRLLERLRRDPGFGAVAGRLDTIGKTLDHDARLARVLAGRPVVLGYYFGQRAQPVADMLPSAAPAASRESTSGPASTRSTGRLPAPVFAAADLASQGRRPASWDGYTANLPALQAAARGAGFFNPHLDPDGLVRQLPLFAEHGGQVYESLGVALLRLYLGDAPMELSPQGLVLHGADRQVTIPASPGLLALVPYGGPAGAQGGRFRYLSADDVLAGRVPPGLLDGRIVLVGTSAPGLADLRATPVGGATPGVEIHASMIAGALDGTVRLRPSGARAIETVSLLAIGVALSLALPAVGAVGTMLLSLLVAMTLAAWNGVAFSNHGWVLPLAGGLLLVLSLALLNLVAGYFAEGRSRRAMMGLFGEYVGPQLVERMAQDPGDFRMDGGDMELTVLFADIRGFTRIAETMQTQQLREYLNLFLTAMTDVIHRYNGTVDKYIGDAVMAFWGAPVDDPLHADHAVSAALAMQLEALRLSAEFESRGWPPLVVGIGLNTGVVRVGDMGSRARRTYTVIGDAVNLASRFEGLSKQLSAGIVAGEATMRAAHSHHFRELGRVPVAGRAEPVRVYEPVAGAMPPPQAIAQPPAPQPLRRSESVA